jgi:hypothetical protein
MSNLNKDIAIYEALLRFSERLSFVDTEPTLDLINTMAQQFPGGKVQLRNYIDTLKIEAAKEKSTITRFES